MRRKVGVLMAHNLTPEQRQRQLERSRRWHASRSEEAKSASYLKARETVLKRRQARLQKAGALRGQIALLNWIASDDEEDR